MDAMIDTVDEALVALHKTSSVWNGDQFANHGPMVVETLGHFGRADVVPGWVTPLLPFWCTAPPNQAAITSPFANSTTVEAWDDGKGADSKMNSSTC